MLNVEHPVNAANEFILRKQTVILKIPEISSRWESENTNFFDKLPGALLSLQLNKAHGISLRTK